MWSFDKETIKWWLTRIEVARVFLLMQKQVAKVSPDLLFDCNYSKLSSAREIALTFCLICLARAPNAKWQLLDDSVAFTAKIQYFYDRLLKFISKEHLLSAGTSSGATPARDSSSSIISSAFFLWRYALILSRDMF